MEEHTYAIRHPLLKKRMEEEKWKEEEEQKERDVERKKRGAEYSQVRCTAPHKLNRRKLPKITGNRVPPIRATHRDLHMSVESWQNTMVVKNNR